MKHELMDLVERLDEPLEGPGAKEVPSDKVCDLPTRRKCAKNNDKERTTKGVFRNCAAQP